MTKRSNVINLRRMRKAFRLSPLAVAIPLILVGCQEAELPAQLYQTAEECIADNPSAADVCNQMYQRALAEAAETAPRFTNQQDCEYEFGAEQCQQATDQSGSSFFMPFMAGMMVSRLLSPSPYYQPMFSSYSRNSPYRYRWFDSRGKVVGRFGDKNFRMNRSFFDSRPKYSRAFERGGFGKMAASRASSGSASGYGARGSWGS